MNDGGLKSLTEGLLKKDFSKDSNKNENENENKKIKKNKHLQSKAFNTIGSIVLGIGAYMIIPTLLQRATGIIYKASKRTTSSADEDWGPEMKKKN